MRRYRKKSRSRHAKKIPVLASVGVLAFGMNAYRGYQQDHAHGLQWNTIGVDANGKFSPSKFAQNIAPPVFGVLGSMAAGKFRMNRYISGIPWFKF